MDTIRELAPLFIVFGIVLVPTGFAFWATNSQENLETVRRRFFGR